MAESRFRWRRRRSGSGNSPDSRRGSAPKGKSDAPPRPVGRSGTVNTRGFISDTETERDLQWPRNLEVYEKMRREDPSVRSMLAMVKTPIRATHWDVEPASQEPEHLEQAAFIREALFDGSHLDGGFDEWLRQALDFLDFGHSVFERVAELKDLRFTVTDPETGEETQIERQGFVLAKLGVRLQQTLVEWHVDERDSSILDHVVQQLPLTDEQPAARARETEDPTQPKIPADRLVILTFEKQGDDFRGQSLLRSAYKPWLYKARLQNIEAIAMERTAGFPVCYPPESVDGNDPVLDEMEKMLRRIRLGEEIYAIMPGPKAQGNNDGWTLEDLEIRGSSADFAAAIERYEGQMTRNVQADFMRLGHENTGARAVGDVQQDPYYQAVEAIVGYVEGVLNEQVVKPLIDWNYETDAYPRVSASKVQAKNIEKLSTFFSALSGPGLITPDPELEAWLRKVADAPDMPRAEQGAGAPGGAPVPRKAPWEPWSAVSSSGGSQLAEGGGTPTPTQKPGEGEAEGEAPTDDDQMLTATTGDELLSQATDEALHWLAGGTDGHGR